MGLANRASALLTRVRQPDTSVAAISTTQRVLVIRHDREHQREPRRPTIGQACIRPAFDMWVGCNPVESESGDPNPLLAAGCNVIPV
jgi:hypothetical protein